MKGFCEKTCWNIANGLKARIQKKGETDAVAWLAWAPCLSTTPSCSSVYANQTGDLTQYGDLVDPEPALEPPFENHDVSSLQREACENAKIDYENNVSKQKTLCRERENILDTQPHKLNSSPSCAPILTRIMKLKLPNQGSGRRSNIARNGK